MNAILDDLRSLVSCYFAPWREFLKELPALMFYEPEEDGWAKARRQLEQMNEDIRAHGTVAFLESMRMRAYGAEQLSFDLRPEEGVA